ncbi:PorV/PorQ family protein [Flexithrix dorotheae]|uniref:putative type IX sorting system protein PorV2 n=1 Tax=Flexithrix dorotheae TaxID=70993 RepID=UPI00036B39AB|nr:PorV/PorQ family protein [Flexithrix dorotheae]
MKLKIFFIIFQLAVISSLHAQNAPKYSNEFMAIGVGARGLAMSNSQAAVTDDVTSGYWNPAGLLNVKEKYAFGLMHASYFAGISNYDYFGFATPIDSRSRIGLSLIRFATDDIPDTRFLYDADGNLNYDNINSFSAADYGFLFSYARRSKLIKGLNLGANFKIIYRSVGVFANAWGFGLDIGAQLKRGNWQFGLVGRDITGTYNTWNYNPETFYDVFAKTGNTIPDNSIEITLPRVIADVAYGTRVKENFGALVTTGVDITFDGARNTLIKTSMFSIDPHLGMELDFKKIVFLRGGVAGFQEIKDFKGGTYWTFQPNFGVGIKIKQFKIDYALTDIGDQSEGLYSNIFSLIVGLGKSKNTKPRYIYGNQ